MDNTNQKICYTTFILDSRYKIASKCDIYFRRYKMQTNELTRERATTSSLCVHFMHLVQWKLAIQMCSFPRYLLSLWHSFNPMELQHDRDIFFIQEVNRLHLNCTLRYLFLILTTKLISWAVFLWCWSWGLLFFLSLIFVCYIT